MSNSKIGKKLRILREKFGYTQQQMANVLNVDRSTYSYYETEKTSPDIATLITLSNVFHVGIEELLGQDNGTAIHQLHDVKHIPAALKNKDITSNDSFIYNLSGDEKQFIAFYRAVSPTTKNIVLQLLKEDLERQRFQFKSKKNGAS